VYLKSYRNSVAVPRHWCQKRKYLQGKRGIEKPPFELPPFIAATGISKIRQAMLEADEQRSSKQKQRHKMQPKLGRMDIDYQILHDAFFKYQTKPKLSRHGDLYYEGKEFEVKLKEKKPGHLSDELKAALGMPEGAPPPWLINMQRYGPPPSYPNLKIPGLNAPIPPNAQFGYHPGGWGKPPVDHLGKPLYGDVFGTAAPELPPEASQPIDRNHWGELESEEEVSSEEEDEDEDEDDDEEDDDEEEEEEEGDAAAAAVAGELAENGAPGEEGPAPDNKKKKKMKKKKKALAKKKKKKDAAEGDDEKMKKIMGGLATPTGFETPERIDLRKKIEKKKREEQVEEQQLHHLQQKQGGEEEEEEKEPKQLYQVLPEKEITIGGAAFGSSHGYVISSLNEKNKKKFVAPSTIGKKKKKDAVNIIKSQKTKEVEVTLNPNNLLNLTAEMLQEMYHEKVAEEAPKKEDVSDVISQHSMKSRSKKAAAEKNKKYKDFKF